MAVHVSIHDVSPAWTAEVEEALRICQDAGARPALLVVPDLHGRSPLLGSEALCRRLCDLQARGHEILLHGLLHRAPERRRRGARDAVIGVIAQRLASAGEAEFIGLDVAEGRRRLEEGERVLGAAGLRIDGFVPPAWAMPRWLLPLLAERGYRFAEDHLRIHDPAGGTSRASVVLNWATRSTARRIATVAFCRVAKHGRALLPARIAIHPADLRSPLVRREIVRLLAWAACDFVGKGRDLLGAARTSPSG